ncbi:hypothetical protein [Priestia megaterium]
MSEQVMNHPRKASMSLNLILQGLLNVVKTTVLIDEDIVISDGATH